MPNLTIRTREDLLESQAYFVGLVAELEVSDRVDRERLTAASRALSDIDAELERRSATRANLPAMPAAQPTPVRAARVVVAPAARKPTTDGETFNAIGERAFARMNRGAEVAARSAAPAPEPIPARATTNVFSDANVAAIYARMNARGAKPDHDELADRLTKATGRLR